MVFWRKKPREPAPHPEVVAAEEASAPYLTGNAREDRLRTEGLLEEVASIAERVARVSREEDLDELLTYIVDASVTRTGAERGMLVLDRGDGEHEVRVARQRGGQPLQGETRYSRSAVGRVLETGQPLKDMFNTSAEAMDLGASVFDLKLRALMCVPLEAGEGPRALRGVLYVDSKAATREFDARDLAYFSTLSIHIAQALRNVELHLDSLERVRLEQSLELAQVVQNNLMPQIPEDFPGFALFGWFQPAERTSGDFYDFFRLKDGRLGGVVGDVTGHGPASALITSAAQASLRTSLRLLPDLGPAVTSVNLDLRMEDGNFITLFVALLSESGEVPARGGGRADSRHRREHRGAGPGRPRPDARRGRAGALAQRGLGLGGDGAGGRRAGHLRRAALRARESRGRHDPRRGAADHRLSEARASASGMSEVESSGASRGGDLLVRDARCYAPPGEGGGRVELRVAAGRVVELGESLEPRGGEEVVVEARGRTVVPGLVDVHVHFRDPGLERKEGWDHGSRGALHGGVTSVVEVQNNPPFSTSRERLLERIEHVAEGPDDLEGRMHVLQVDARHLDAQPAAL